MTQRHLVAVWNPSYEADAMDQHLSVLLTNAARFRDARFVEVGSKTMDLMTSPPLSLGQLALAIGDNKALNDWLKRRLEPRDWVSISLPPILENLASYRNPAAHATRITREEVVALRDGLVGVGCTGRLVELGNVRVR